MAKIQCNVISYVLKRTVDIVVVVPTPTFGDCLKPDVSHTPKAPYPVLYLLHGAGNNQATWTGYTNVELYAEENQIVIVNMAAEDKSYVSREGGDDFFRFVSEELPDFVTGLFPVSKRPEDTYIAGLSMGGFGTIVHALNHPERFCAMGAFSAATIISDRHPEWEDRFKWDWLADHVKESEEKLPKMYLACGKEDFLYQNDVEFRDRMMEAGADVTWDELEGYGHEWRFWDIEVEKFMKWLPRTDAYAKDGPRKA